MKQIFRKCAACGGTGRETGTLETPPGSTYDNPCENCKGLGRLEGDELSDELIDFLVALDAKVNALTEALPTILDELDYIHGKVTAIWNQVKPGGGPP